MEGRIWNGIYCDHQPSRMTVNQGFKDLANITSSICIGGYEILHSATSYHLSQLSKTRDNPEAVVKLWPMLPTCIKSSFLLYKIELYAYVTTTINKWTLGEKRRAEVKSATCSMRT